MLLLQLVTSQKETKNNPEINLSLFIATLVYVVCTMLKLASDS